MELVKIIDGSLIPYTEEKFRLDNPQTLYGKTISSVHLNDQGVYRVFTLPKPEIPIGKKCCRNEVPTKNQFGHWVLGWTLMPLNAQEARSLRNKLLAETDWTANSDVTMSAEMLTYRQALRDITDQAGFPDSVTWPIKP